MTIVLVGLMFGLAGSLHCAAMCGPLVGVMAPVFGRRVTPALWYQAGRLLSYVLIGGFAGLAGAAAGLAGLGRGLSVVTGVIMLLMAFGLLSRSAPLIGAWWTRQLKRALDVVSRARDTHAVVSAVGAGAVNGALPCGLVYAAALAATTAGGPLEAAMVMLAFGVGTAPMMFGLWTSTSLVPTAVRRRLRVLTPAALCVVGVMLVLRGLVHHH